MNVLNKKSGLQGMSGVSSDMRDLRAAAAEGNEDAKNAIEVLCYGIAKYVGGSMLPERVPITTPSRGVRASTTVLLLRWIPSPSSREPFQYWRRNL